MIPRFLAILFLIMILAPNTQAQPPIGIGQWRTHHPFGNAHSLTDAGDEVFCATNVTFFSYDKESRSITRFDKVSGLSDIGVKFVRHYEPMDILLVVYDNANIDLIQDNSIINLSDIKRKSIAGEKVINNVYFRDSLAYLSTTFGIVVLDLVKIEIKDTYIIGTNGENTDVNDLTSDSLYFYAATDEGVKTALIKSANLANFQEWSSAPLNSKASQYITNFEETVYVEIDDTIFSNAGGDWTYFFADTNYTIENLATSNNQLVISEFLANSGAGGRIHLMNANGEFSDAIDPKISRPTEVAVDDDGSVWSADAFLGLVHWSPQASEQIIPNGPFSTDVANMSFARERLWVAPGGVDAGWGYTYNMDGFYSYTENWWSNYNRYNLPPLDTMFNIFSVLADPDEDMVYYGSFFAGLIEYTDGSYQLFDQSNSSLGGFVGDEKRTHVAGMAIDESNNLWVANHGAAAPISVKKKDGTWRSFVPTPRPEGNWLSQVVIDDFDQKWIVVPRSNQDGILVFNHGDDIDDPSDDAFRVLNTGGGQGNLPTNDVLCLANDLDGEIWVGTAEGIAVFYCPSSVFSEFGCDAQQIIVTQDGFAGNLLETERVNAIAIDGGNRKWIGTSNGVWLLSPDGTEQIAYFNEENSPLLSDNVLSIAIDPGYGEVFFGTEKGIISYRGEATTGGEEHDEVTIFPNPVRENYEGPIAIHGLPQDADVKITDTDGRLIYQTTALGGQAVWDGKSPAGDKAKTGVYLIFSTNEDGSSKNVGKILMIK